MGLTRIRAEQISNIDYKQAVRVATTANVNLSGGAPTVVDGVTLVQGNRVLVTGQSTGSQNGIYVVQTLGTGSNGTWIRSADGNQTGEIEPGMVIMVTEGTTYADTPWKLTTNGEIIIGTTALTFQQFATGGSGTPGGSNTQIQYNSDNTFAGSSSLTWNGSQLYVNGTANVTGNVSGSYFLGNGSQLTGIQAGAVTTVANTAPVGPAQGDIWINSDTGSQYIYFTSGGNSQWAEMEAEQSFNFGSEVDLTAVNTDILPAANLTYSLGNATNQWSNIYVGGNIISGNVSATTGTFTNVAGTLTTAAQPNITSVGTLSSLTATGNITANYFIGNGSQLTGINRIEFAAGNAAAPSITTTGDTNTGIFFPASDTIAFSEGGVEAARFDSSGNLGIGTSSPGVRLDIKGSGTSGQIRFAGAGSIINRLYGDDDGIVVLSADTGNTAAGSYMAFQVDGSEHIRIDPSGKVGIGTNSPSQKLTVSVSSGSVVGLAESTATNGEASWQLNGKNSSGTVRSAIFKYDNTDLVRIGTASAIPMRFETTDAERMRIFAGGGVGIGSTTDPGNKGLSIGGAIMENVYTIVDGAAFEIDPSNGTIQLITLGASRTPKATNFAAGESVTLMVDDGSAYTITWTDATFGASGVIWETNSGSAPTLSTTGYTTIVLWKVGTQVYGARVGNA